MYSECTEIDSKPSDTDIGDGSCTDTYLKHVLILLLSVEKSSCRCYQPYSHIHAQIAIITSLNKRCQPQCSRLASFA